MRKPDFWDENCQQDEENGTLPCKRKNQEPTRYRHSLKRGPDDPRNAFTFTDTTLRDGQQTQGVQFSTLKGIIATALRHFGR